MCFYKDKKNPPIFYFSEASPYQEVLFLKGTEILHIEKFIYVDTFSKWVDGLVIEKVIKIFAI
ncbi:MAG: hypothetical protein CM15mP30_4980 [Pelagibacteraceae bacterium]|nr:MAG: hypothetical protein CM15mP30_4980 [Pelagibacteraceae bacterium]